LIDKAEHDLAGMTFLLFIKNFLIFVFYA